MIIERVQRLADFQHHKIRDIHDVVDAADADFFQRLLAANPGWARLSRRCTTRAV